MGLSNLCQYLDTGNLLILHACIMKRQIRRKIGQYLTKLREDRRMSITEVAAYLTLYKIKCSRTNLSRIEADNATIRHDILAGLAIVYEVSSDEILFRVKVNTEKF
jgi:transcriptional regulator with XRE-family HTH domain